MKIVIDIPEDIYGRCREYRLHCGEAEVLEGAVANGTPLPKGHGRLGDLDKIANDVNALKDNWNRYGNEYEGGRYESYDYAVDVIEGAQTIIPADKAESEE